MTLPEDGIRRSMVGLDIMTFYLFNSLVGLADVFVLDVDHRIDEVFSPERAETVFPTKAGE